MFDEKKVSIWVGGGLGDVIMNCLANPKSHCEDGDDGFPTHNHLAAVWLRRLEDFKNKHSDVHIKIVSTSHCSGTAELFESNPYIDAVIQFPWTVDDPHTERLLYYDLEEYKALTVKKPTRIPVEEEYNPIKWFYDYKDYLSGLPCIQLNDDDRDTLNEIITGYKYITMHPTAGAIDREIVPIKKYIDIAKEFIKRGYCVIILSGSSIGIKHEEGIINLTGLVNARISTTLVLESSGFVGTHSSMCIPAWYSGKIRGIKTVCFIPDDPRFDKMIVDKNAVAFGFSEPFNLTKRFRPDTCEADNFDIEEVIDFVINDK